MGVYRRVEMAENWPGENQLRQALEALLKQKPPASQSKINTICHLAFSDSRYFSNVAHHIINFARTCPSKHRLSSLYIIDAICKGTAKARPEGDVFIEVFSRQVGDLFHDLFSCPQKDKESIVRVARLWADNKVLAQPAMDTIASVCKQVMGQNIYERPESANIPPPQPENLPNLTHSASSTTVNLRRSLSNVRSPPENHSDDDDDDSEDEETRLERLKSQREGEEQRRLSEYQPHMQAPPPPQKSTPASALQSLCMQMNQSTPPSQPYSQGVMSGQNSQPMYQQANMSYPQNPNPNPQTSYSPMNNNPQGQLPVNPNIPLSVLGPLLELIRQNGNMRNQPPPNQPPFQNQPGPSQHMSPQYPGSQFQNPSHGMPPHQPPMNQQPMHQPQPMRSSHSNIQSQPPPHQQHPGMPPNTFPPQHSMPDPRGPPPNRNNFPPQMGNNHSHSNNPPYDQPPRDNFPEITQPLRVLCTTLYLGNLSKGITEDILRSHFSQFGKILTVKFCQGNKAFVQYKNRESAEMGKRQLDGTKIMDKPVQIGWALNPRMSKDGFERTNGEGDMPPQTCTPQLLADLEARQLIIKRPGVNQFYFQDNPNAGQRGYPPPQGAPYQNQPPPFVGHNNAPPNHYRQDPYGQPPHQGGGGSHLS